ncbi:MAG: ATP-binding cassette domain-containing protein [Actinomycetota bacterium]
MNDVLTWSIGEAAAPTLRARGLVAGHGEHRTEPLDLDLGADQIVALVGPSGVGKTTVLRTLADLVSPIDGEVVWAPSPPTLCFQDARLLPWRSAIDNVLFGLSRRPGDPDRARARALLAEVGLADKSERLPIELSGGEQRRVSIVRSAMAATSCLLVDEPFAHLDHESADSVIAILTSLVRSGTPVGVAVHSETDAERLAARSIPVRADPTIR